MNVTTMFFFVYPNRERELVFFDAVYMMLKFNKCATKRESVTKVENETQPYNSLACHHGPPTTLPPQTKKEQIHDALFFLDGPIDGKTL